MSSHKPIDHRTRIRVSAVGAWASHSPTISGRVPQTGTPRSWRDAGKVRSEPKHPSAHQSGSADPCRGDGLTVPAAAQKQGGWTDLQLLWAPARRLAPQVARCATVAPIGEAPVLAAMRNSGRHPTGRFGPFPGKSVGVDHGDVCCAGTVRGCWHGEAACRESPSGVRSAADVPWVAPRSNRQARGRRSRLRS